jgi:hypothetical protein
MIIVQHFNLMFPFLSILRQHALQSQKLLAGFYALLAFPGDEARVLSRSMQTGKPSRISERQSNQPVRSPVAIESLIPESSRTLLNGDKK